MGPVGTYDAHCIVRNVRDAVLWDSLILVSRRRVKENTRRGVGRFVHTNANQRVDRKEHTHVI